MHLKLMVVSALAIPLMIGCAAQKTSEKPAPAPAPAAAKKPALLMGASASMLANTCAGCHGTNGVSTGPAAPTIAGLSPDYFVETMEDFASGEIKSTIMGRIAKGYTEEEIQAMADFYAAKPFIKAKQTYDAKLAAKGAKLHEEYCEECHKKGAQSPEEDAGILAGQWTPYVNWTLADYQSGEREASKKMAKKLNAVVEKEGSTGVAALLNYYASQQ